MQRSYRNQLVANFRNVYYFFYYFHNILVSGYFVRIKWQFFKKTKIILDWADSWYQGIGEEHNQASLILIIFHPFKIYRHHLLRWWVETATRVPTLMVLMKDLKHNLAHSSGSNKWPMLEMEVSNPVFFIFQKYLPSFT